MGELSTASDVDFYRIGLQLDQMLWVYCAGKSIGSGLDDFTLSAFDVNGSLVTAQTETNVPIEWSNSYSATGSGLIAEADEDVYLQVSATLPEQPVSRFYYCYVKVVPAQ